MNDLLGNRWIVVPIYAWLIAQLAKVAVNLVKEHRLNLRYLTTAGGMPSSHTALVTALATTAGRQQGLGSALFAITTLFALVVMYDAAGVRRAVGIQAGILNRMLDEYFEHQQFSEQRLRELIGHTPVQVLVGAAIGIMSGFAWA